jgi:hypothetical protein
MNKLKMNNKEIDKINNVSIVESSKYEWIGGKKGVERFGDIKSTFELGTMALSTRSKKQVIDILPDAVEFKKENRWEQWGAGSGCTQFFKQIYVIKDKSGNKLGEVVPAMRSKNVSNGQFPFIISNKAILNLY